MMEEAHTFGRDGCLVGIITEPDAGLLRNSTPAVLLWNAGLLHHVGPHRLYVTLARNLASQGFIVLRFDLSGLGDSKMPKEIRPHKERVLGDIREAMDFLSAKMGVHEFVLIGLCSGADDVHPIAVMDSRVSGAVLLDAYGYRTWGFYVRHIARRLFRLRKWKRFLKQKYESIFRKTFSQQIFPRLFPPKKDVKIEIMELIERGVNLLYIYTGGVQIYFNYRDQFKHMFGFKPAELRHKLQLEHFNESDHLYTLANDRAKLLKTICDWMQSHYKGAEENWPGSPEGKCVA